MRCDCGTIDFTLEYFVNRQCAPDWHLHDTALKMHNLMYLYAGRCHLVQQGQAYDLQAGDLVYIRQGNSRLAETPADCPMQCYAINFLVRNGDPEQAILPPFLRSGPDEALLRLFQQLNQVWLEKRPDYQLAARGLLMLVISRINQLHLDQKNRIIPDQRIEQIRQYISRHLAGPLGVDQLAGLCQLNPVYFGWLFHQKTGQTLRAYINQLRIQRARDLLTSGLISVSEAARQCGYSDLYYFSKVFKRITGLAPSRFAQITGQD